MPIHISKHLIWNEIKYATSVFRKDLVSKVVFVVGQLLFVLHSCFVILISHMSEFLTLQNYCECVYMSNVSLLHNLNAVWNNVFTKNLAGVGGQGIKVNHYEK